jgi:hypothetical protein
MQECILTHEVLEMHKSFFIGQSYYTINMLHGVKCPFRYILDIPHYEILPIFQLEVEVEIVQFYRLLIIEPMGINQVAT